jgi:hypothetical protein
MTDSEHMTELIETLERRLADLQAAKLNAYEREERDRLIRLTGKVQGLQQALDIAKDIRG